jgi:hypothetical protein
MNWTEEAEETLKGILICGPLALDDFFKVSGGVHLEQLERHDADLVG